MEFKKLILPYNKRWQMQMQKCSVRMTSSYFQGEYRSFLTFITWIPSNPILYVEFRLSYEPALTLAGVCVFILKYFTTFGSFLIENLWKCRYWIKVYKHF